jgi:hypothetical protein
MSKATPSKCEQKFASMMVLIKRTIFSFKRSGEGERDRVVGDFDIDMDELNDEDVASGTDLMQNNRREDIAEWISLKTSRPT